MGLFGRRENKKDDKCEVRHCGHKFVEHDAIREFCTKRFCVCVRFLPEGEKEEIYRRNYV